MAIRPRILESPNLDRCSRKPASSSKITAVKHANTKMHWTRSHAQQDTPLTGLLDSHLSSLLRLSCESQQQLLNLCWGTQFHPGRPWDHRPFEFYFHHYHQYCHKVPDELKTCTHRHLCQSIQHVKGGNREACEEAVVKILPAGSSRSLAKECIEFAGKAILFIDLSEWRDQETFEQFLARRIACRTKQAVDFRMPRSFNLRTFAEVAGINIQWTRELSCHLEVGESDNVIAVFHCVTVLDLYEQSELAPLFPDRFIEETRRTLSLLLPIADDKAKSWMKSKQQKSKLDPLCASCHHLQASKRHVRNFSFWGERLVIVKEVFDEHQPRGILQVWRDSRNQVQWWTFWIAIAVSLLSIIACVEGALQVYKAYYPSA